jgi:hypothetical protein
LSEQPRGFAAAGLSRCWEWRWEWGERGGAGRTHCLLWHARAQAAELREFDVMDR